MISTIRHQEIFNAHDNNQGITIIGAGAVGSRTFASLIELGLTKIQVYDPDVVENHNLANQLFVKSDVGLKKVSGLARWAAQKLGQLPPALTFIDQYFDTNSEVYSTVFLLVDSLETRGTIASDLASRSNVVRIIDVRMAATHGNVFTFAPITQLESYLRTLGSDEDAEVSACGSPFSVAPTAAILANLAVWQFIHSKNNPFAVDNRINVFLNPLTIATSNL